MCFEFWGLMFGGAYYMKGLTCIFEILRYPLQPGDYYKGTIIKQLHDPILFIYLFIYKATHWKEIDERRNEIIFCMAERSMILTVSPPIYAIEHCTGIRGGHGFKSH